MLKIGRETSYAAHPSVGSNAAFQWGILFLDPAVDAAGITEADLPPDD